MKKIMSVAVLAALCVPGFAGAANVSNDSVWYGGIRGEMSLLNWENSYSSNDPAAKGEFNGDSYSFEPVFGGSLFVGRVLEDGWRGEVEAGLIGQFTDSGSYGANFKMTIPYVSVNVMYDFENNLYAGGALGVAMPKVDVSMLMFESDERNISPKFDLMVGYSHELTERLNLDLRYRFSLMFGPNVKADYTDGVNSYWFKSETDTIFSNSFSIGLRYDF